MIKYGTFGAKVVPQTFTERPNSQNKQKKSCNSIPWVLISYFKPLSFGNLAITIWAFWVLEWTYYDTEQGACKDSIGALFLIMSSPLFFCDAHI